MMSLAFFLGCGKKDESPAAPAPAPDPGPATPTQPAPPPSGGSSGFPASVEGTSPGTAIDPRNDNSKYFEQLRKALTRGTATSVSQTRAYYTVNRGQQSATLQPAGSPTADNIPVTTLTLRGRATGGYYFFGYMVDTVWNPFHGSQPTGFEFREYIEVVPNTGIVIQSTDQIALFTGNQAWSSAQWIMKVLVGPSNPPMQIFKVSPTAQPGQQQPQIEVLQKDFTTSFTSN